MFAHRQYLRRRGLLQTSLPAQTLSAAVDQRPSLPRHIVQTRPHEIHGANLELYRQVHGRGCGRAGALSRALGAAPRTPWFVSPRTLISRHSRPWGGVDMVGPRKSGGGARSRCRCLVGRPASPASVSRRRMLSTAILTASRSGVMSPLTRPSSMPPCSAAMLLAARRSGLSRRGSSPRARIRRRPSARGCSHRRNAAASAGRNAGSFFSSAAIEPNGQAKGPPGCRCTRNTCRAHRSMSCIESMWAKPGWAASTRSSCRSITVATSSDLSVN